MPDHVPPPPEVLAARRARYEEHQRRGLDAAPRSLPPFSPRPVPAPEGVLHREEVPFGWYWATRLDRGESLRLGPTTPGARTPTVTLACWSARDPSERMNLPDTVKVQWTTELSRGRVVLSDLGRVLLSVTEDSCGAHDALAAGGGGLAPPRDTRSNMVLAASKLGLSRRDLSALLALFAPVRVDAGGRLEWRGAMLGTDDWVELRAEDDLLLALSVGPHALDPAPVEAPLEALRLAARPVAADDICRTATAEAVRAFGNTGRA